MGTDMARMTRSGTLVGPGTNRKLRPAMIGCPDCDWVQVLFSSYSEKSQQRSFKKITVPIHVHGQIEGVLARQAFCQFGVPALERLDDPQMIDDRTGCAVALRDGGAPDRAHVQEQVTRCVFYQLRTAQADDGLVKGDVHI